MNITIEQKTLKDALKKIQDCVKKDRMFEFTSHVSIKTDNNSVIISATNLDVSLDIQCKAVVSEPGEHVVNRELLQLLVVHAKREFINIFTDKDNNKRLRIQNAILNTTLQSYEPLPVRKNEKTISFALVQAKKTAELIKNTSYAVSTDPKRYNIMNVYLDRQEQGNLSMVATDGFRLAKMHLSDETFDTDISILIPKKSIDALYKLLKKSPHPLVSLGVSGTTLVIKSNTKLMLIRLEEGTFPDYKKIIPEHNNIRIKFNKTTLKNAILSCPLSKKDYKLGLEVAKGKAIITGADTTIEIAPLEHIGKDISIKLNYKFLLDVLATIDGTVVDLAFLDSASSVLITEPGNDNKLALIMPLL